MSVALSPCGLSNPRLKLRVITVVIVIVIAFHAVLDIGGACADVLGLATALLVERVQQPNAATTRTVNERPGPSMAA